MPSKKQIEACQTPAGGYTKRTLARWGVPWPPPPGWKQKLIAEHKERVREARARERANQRGKS